MNCHGNKKYDLGVDSIFVMESTFFPLNSWSKYCKAGAVYVLIPTALCACTQVQMLRSWDTVHRAEAEDGAADGAICLCSWDHQVYSMLQPLPENLRQRRGYHPGQTVVPRLCWARLGPPRAPATSLFSDNIHYFGSWKQLVPAIYHGQHCVHRYLPWHQKQQARLSKRSGKALVWSDPDLSECWQLFTSPRVQLQWNCSYNKPRSFARWTVYLRVFHALTVPLLTQQPNRGSSQTALSKATVPLPAPSQQPLQRGSSFWSCWGLWLLKEKKHTHTQTKPNPTKHPQHSGLCQCS